MYQDFDGYLDGYGRKLRPYEIWGIKFNMNFLKGIKLDFICMKIKLMKNKNICSQKF